mmetsp:Transcript_32898/g.71185  ORF Transcript_32898/g.71185 Transcript_32898/m.71185 type:complete len:491 (-) Transcript_32898:2252-3724(-)|eukprot:CAMPEP_0178614092 /NCGR_PEP_ID=MMETSP0698-20121128/1985_1 /TAXON_ID=265572 /ORGANISM="Extubocellulus spinifer, Strain CCMP396" /LENGTH=490 /DNA_ID=CAMNT_0020252815 /DNA_START=427 /DNA_END=1899 /DNA_ORIENTATION=+
MENLTHAEQMVLLVVPKCVAFCSTFGSLMIISQIVRNRPNRTQMQQQIVLGLSIVDVCVSVTWLFNNFFQPEWSPLYYPLGNQASCSTQGFFVQFMIAGVLYNATLSLYYLAVIKFNYSERKLKKWKRRVHIIPLSFGLATAVTGLALKLYNPANWDCYIAPPPPEPTCTYYDICDRGQHAHIYQWAFFFGPLWAAIVVVVISMGMVIACVEGQERKMASWTKRAQQGRNQGKKRNEKLRCLYTQSLLYVGAFLATFTFPTVARITQLATQESPSWLIVLAGCTVPVAGLFNSLAYFVPRYRKEKAQTGKPGWAVAWSIVMRAFGCCACQCALLSRADRDDGSAGGSHGRLATSMTRFSVKMQNDMDDIVDSLDTVDMDSENVAPYASSGDKVQPGIGTKESDMFADDEGRGRDASDVEKVDVTTNNKNGSVRFGDKSFMKFSGIGTKESDMFVDDEGRGADAGDVEKLDVTTNNKNESGKFGDKGFTNL